MFKLPFTATERIFYSREYSLGDAVKENADQLRRFFFGGGGETPTEYWKDSDTMFLITSI